MIETLGEDLILFNISDSTKTYQNSNELRNLSSVNGLNQSVHNGNHEQIEIEKLKVQLENVKSALKILDEDIRQIKLSEKSNEQNENLSKLTTLKNEFVEWSLLTKFDGFSKVFQTKVVAIKIIWLVIFLLFTGLTAALVIKNITGFCKFEVTSLIEVKIERPTNFPAITICNNNPFTSSQSQSLMDMIALENYGITMTNMTYDQAFQYSSSLNDLTKMYAKSLNYSDTERENLADSLPLYLFSFNKKNLSGSSNQYFRRYYSYLYGNCYQFNTGFNFSNSPVPLLKQTGEGKEYGLQVIYGPLVNKNEYMSSYSDGLAIFIHNQSLLPLTSSAIGVKTGEETNIALGRTFTYNSPKPYTECDDMSSFQSELYNLLMQTNFYYRQHECFNLCMQRNIINACGCYWTRYTRMYGAQPCLNLTQLECVLSEQNAFDEEKCISDCPLECDSLSYHYSLSSLTFPSQSILDKFYSDTNILNYVQSTYGVDLSTKELVKKFFQENYVALNVYYLNFEYTQITEIPTFTWIDLLSQIGGSLGMFLGFSLFHLIELVEILMVLCVVWLKK